MKKAKPTRNPLSTIQSTMDPITEKRLLGNLKPPNRNYSTSSRPKRIERVELKLQSPPKAAENLSKLSSIQQFQNDFIILDNNAQKLHQISSPKDCERMFDAVAEIKDSIPIFKSHCKKIAKQKKLNAEVSQTSFNFYKEYSEQFDIFVERMNAFGDQIHNIYTHEIISLFQSMDASVSTIFDACNKDPAARSLLQQYRKYCDDSMKNVDQTLVDYLEDTSFTAFTSDEIEHIAETAKTFGRFFERDLYPALRQCIPNNEQLPGAIQQFHKSYIQLIPLITGAPMFVELYSQVLKDLDVLKKDMSVVRKEVGDERILKKKTRVEIIQNESENNDEEKDDFHPALRALAAYFNTTINEDQKVSDILDNIQTAARKAINELKSTITKLQNEMERPEGVPKDLYKKQLTDIREFKKELEQKVNNETDSFCRSIIYSIKSMIPDAKIDTNISYVRQIQYITNELRNTIGKNNENAAKYQVEIENCKSFLKKIGPIDESLPLDKILKNSFMEAINNEKNAKEKLKSIQFEHQKLRSDLMNFISSVFAVDEADISDQSINDLFVTIQQQINRNTNEIKRARDNSAKVLEVYKLSRDKIAKMLNIECTGFDVDEVESDFSKLENQLQIKLSNEVIFQQNIYVFIKKIVDALSLRVSLSDPTREELNNSMASIMKKIENDSETSIKILNNQPDKGLFKLPALCYKYFLQLFSLITGEKLKADQNLDLKFMFEASLKKFTEIKSESIREIFSDLINTENYTTNKTSVIQKLHDEVQDSRIMKDQLSKLHQIIESITIQLKNEEMVFIPGTKQLEALASISASLLVLRNEKEVESNNVIQSMADMNNTLCELISAGKFSPERTRSLLIYQNELKEMIEQMRNGNAKY